MYMLNAAQITAFRERLGMNQTQFAAELDVSWFAVYRWEHDNRHPSWKNMEKLYALAAKHGLDLPLVGNGAKR